MITTVNPATEKELKKYQFLTGHELTQKIENSQKSFLSWKNTSIPQRLSFLPRLQKQLEMKSDVLARALTQEMGKPLEQSRAEIKKCENLCQYIFENAEIEFEDIIVPTSLKKSYLHFEPKGIVFGIMPWNFPFWQTFRFALPCLVSGNSVLLKQAPGTFGCGLLIEKLFQDLNMGSYLFQNLLIDTQAAKKVIEHPFIQGVSFTGSTAGGCKVAEIAGLQMKKGVFELGGADAYLILDDADVELAAKKLLQSRMINTGQSCVAAKRFITLPKSHDNFLQALEFELDKYQSGDPTQSQYKLGPLARQDLRQQLSDQVELSIQKGAQIFKKCNVPEGKGYYYPATVLTHVQRGQPAFEEELFGPVASVIAAKDEAEAMEWANSTVYGLGGGIFSQDAERAELLVASEMNSGMVAVNDFVKSTPELPFGGEKMSGVGRELGSLGFKEFVNVKTVVRG